MWNGFSNLNFNNFNLKGGGTGAFASKFVAGTVAIATLNILLTEGLDGVTKNFIFFLRKLPGVNNVIAMVLKQEVKGAAKMLAGMDDTGLGDQADNVIAIPNKGVSTEVILTLMDKLHSKENASEEGKAFAYTYTSEKNMEQFSVALRSAYETFAEDTGSANKDHESMIKKCWSKFMHSNGLNPMMYPSLKRFETEVISMTTWMLNGDGNCAGAMTSGGTESILMAIKCYRDRARALLPYIKKPNMVVPTTIHPAFEKAAHYFDVEIRHVPIGPDCRVLMPKVRDAIDRNTILLVGSAPQYCHAVVDPIEDLAALALEKGLPLHVDACFGGFMLPWLEKLGKKIPLWDFRVPGVTSISADVHKYGYSSKGASIIVYKNKELRKHQYFAYSEWPGGLFGSPSMAGSRPGGMIAAAWAAMVGMGQSGYLDIAREVLNTTMKIEEGLKGIAGIEVLSKPDMTALAIVSSPKSKISILAVADQMEKKGWKMERQQLPDSLHMSILPQHASVVDQLLEDLRASVKEVRLNPALASQGSTGVYGMVAAIPDKGIIDDFIVSFFGTMYTADTSNSILGEI